MPKMRLDWPNIVIAGFAGFSMLIGFVMWLSSVDAKASQGAKAAVELQDFRAEVIDRLARIEQDTKAIRNKK